MTRSTRAHREKKGSPRRRSRGVFGGGLRAAIYARVSTADQQTIPEQVRQLEELAKRRGWKIVRTVREVASGAAKRAKRDELLDAARRREFDAILVWKLDRWGRSVADLVATINELTSLGVAFVSFTEALDLSTPSGRALAGMLAVFAEFERDLIRERVRAGLERGTTRRHAPRTTAYGRDARQGSARSARSRPVARGDRAAPRHRRIVRAPHPRCGKAGAASRVGLAPKRATPGLAPLEAAQRLRARSTRTGVPDTCPRTPCVRAANFSGEPPRTREPRVR